MNIFFDRSISVLVHVERPQMLLQGRLRYPPEQAAVVALLAMAKALDGLTLCICSVKKKVVKMWLTKGSAMVPR